MSFYTHMYLLELLLLAEELLDLLSHDLIQPELLLGITHLLLRLTVVNKARQVLCCGVGQGGRGRRRDGRSAGSVCGAATPCGVQTIARRQVQQLLLLLGCAAVLTHRQW